MSEDYQRDIAAFERALADQENAALDRAAESGVKLAALLVGFHQTLKSGELDVDLCAELTATYFGALLGGVEIVADEDED